MTSLTIDIGSPIIKASTANIVERAALGADDGSDSLNEGIVEGGPHEDGLGERGRMAEISR